MEISLILTQKEGGNCDICKAPFVSEDKVIFVDGSLLVHETCLELDIPTLADFERVEGPHCKNCDVELLPHSMAYFSEQKKGWCCFPDCEFKDEA